MSPSADMKDPSRKTQDGIIIAFTAIFCSYYWATMVWPFIQRRIDMNKEKSATMMKLKMRQQAEDEDGPVENTNAVVTSPLKALTKQLQRRFDFARPVKKDIANQEGNMKNAVGGTTVEDIYTPSEEENDLSPQTSTVGKFTITRTGAKEIVEIDDEDQNEDEEIEEVVVGSQLRNRSHLRSPSSNSLSVRRSGTAHSSESESHPTTGEEVSSSTRRTSNSISSDPVRRNTERRTDLTSLWGHISRTATTFDDTSGTSNTQSNPWSVTHIPSVSTSSSRPVLAITMTYAEARNLRVRQDEEYSASIDAERDREESAREADRQYLMLMSRIDGKKAAFDNFPSEPDINEDGSVTLSFRFQVISEDSERINAGTNDENSPQSDSSSSGTINRRFLYTDKFSLLFDFVTCHDFCPVAVTSLEISLFHPKKSFKRDDRDERNLTDIGIDSDIVIWVKILR